MIRYHKPTRVSKCPKCGADMKVGGRVYMTLAYELGDRHKRESISSFLCRNCADGLLGEVGIEFGEKDGDKEWR